MELGCIDMGCVEKPKYVTTDEKDSGLKERSASKFGKSNRAKDTLKYSISNLSKLTSQISKPPRRKTSPINFFSRKNVEPYLKRKIKMLQEVDGMHSTLDETLGDSNPHYSKLLREKMAIREAAEKAIDARKAVMVEASWCRILQAARLETKDAEDRLSKAEVSAAETCEAARAVGAIMNDLPESAQNHTEIETSFDGGSPTMTYHTVLATFETAFEVDKQVANAVKAAFIKLGNSSSINKDDFKELLCKISENPDSVSEFYAMPEPEGVMKDEEGEDKMVDMMLSRLRCLKEDELAALATIVATSGLNAALAETDTSKHSEIETREEHPGGLKETNIRESLRRRTSRNSFSRPLTRVTGEAVIPSLDKFLVKRLTRLEREVLEAKKARTGDEKIHLIVDAVKLKEGSTALPDLGSVLVKHSSKLEKEIVAARMDGKSSEMNKKKAQVKQVEVPSLDKVLVKRLTRLEREVQEARNRNKLDQREANDIKFNRHSKGKENMDINKIDKASMTPHVSKMDEVSKYGCLDKVLIKHVSRLEMEKMDFCEERMQVKPKHNILESDEGSLDQVLVKHKSRLEKEKMVTTEEHQDDSTNHFVSWKQAREKEMQAAWGGLSLGNSMRPHVSRLQREKAAWIQAEEEEKKKAIEQVL